MTNEFQIPSDLKSLINEANVIPPNTISGDYIAVDRVSRFEKCTMTDHSRIVVDELTQPWVALFFEELDIHGTSIITRTDRFNLDGQDGMDGRNGRNATSSGEQGEHGGNGENGHDGASLQVPEVYVFIKKLSYLGNTASPSEIASSLSFLFDGYPGGSGGKGGRGGDGGDGAQGHSADGNIFNCRYSQGRGGNGGDSGSPGTGGRARSGTDARNTYCVVAPAHIIALQSATFSNLGGRPGNRGADGDLGVPGRGGRRGNNDTNCKDDVNKDGRPGERRPVCFNFDNDTVGGEEARALFHDEFDWSEITN